MEEKEDFWGEIESAQQEPLPSVMISGEPQSMTMPQQMYGTQQQMILMQQPSSAPKVIGIFVIIYGAINALGGLLGSFSSNINKRKKTQTKVNKIKGTKLINFFIFKNCYKS